LQLKWLRILKMKVHTSKNDLSQSDEICTLTNVMAVVKKRNEQTESRLLLESSEPVELPPAEVDESAVLVQFDKFKPFIHELLEELREGTMAEIVPVMNDGSTFAIHGETKTFWVKIWHKPDSEMRQIERVQIFSCVPSTLGLKITF